MEDRSANPKREWSVKVVLMSITWAYIRASWHMEEKAFRGGGGGLGLCYGRGFEVRVGGVKNKNKVVVKVRVSKGRGQAWVKG